MTAMTGVSGPALPVDSGIDQARQMVSTIQNTTAGANPANGAAAVASDTSDTSLTLLSMGIGGGFDGAA